jgi:hypothetical protein
MADRARRDVNQVTGLLAESNAANGNPVSLYADPSTHRLLVDASVSVSGLATAVTDGEAVDAADVGNLALGTDGTNYQVLKTDSSGELQVDVLSSALPTGASTSAKQDTIIGHVDGIETLLTTIDGRVDGVETLLTAIDGHVDQIEGYVDGVEGLLSTIDGHVDGVETSLSSIDAKTPALGQALAAASTPVVLTAAQITTLTPPAAITNYANETGGNLAAIAASASVLDDWDESDRAKVTLQKAATATVTSVNDTASSTTLLASNASRLGVSIFNDSTVALYIKLGTTASATDFTVKLITDDYYEVPAGYTGRIDGIWASDASGAARITELT